MKKLQNNSENFLTFVNSGEATLDITGIVFRQLGSSIEESIPAIQTYGDCYTTIVSVTLRHNELINTNYVIRVINGTGETVFTSNAIVSGDISQDNYTIYEQSSFSDTIGDLPVQVIFNTFDNTFDNTFG